VIVREIVFDNKLLMMMNSANMQIYTFEKFAGKCPILALLSAGHTEKDFLRNPVKVLLCAKVSVHCIQLYTLYTVKATTYSYA
jgi:hypothetical protein